MERGGPRDHRAATDQIRLLAGRFRIWGSHPSFPTRFSPHTTCSARGHHRKQRCGSECSIQGSGAGRAKRFVSVPLWIERSPSVLMTHRSKDRRKTGTWEQRETQPAGAGARLARILCSRLRASSCPGPFLPASRPGSKCSRRRSADCPTT